MTKINQGEYEILKGLSNQWKWIARDSNTSLWVYEKEPIKHEDFWDEFNGCLGIAAIDLYQFIQWENEYPYSIAELIEDYENESEGSEVKKDKKWLVDKLTKERNETDVHDSAYQYLSEFIAEVEQLDETEVLSQEWIDDNTWNNHYVGKPFVYVEDLQNLLVPKQEKIKVPDWFAEWCKGRVWGDRLHEGKEFTRSDVRALVEIADGEDLYGLTPEQADEIFRNFFKYLDAFFYGYEVEEGEQKYIVKLPLPGNKTNDFAVVDNYGDIWIDDEWPSHCKMTEKEIKALPKGEVYFEHFAVKVEELEE